MNATRKRIASRVRRDPGIHFNELVRELDLAPGQVQYHLRKLEDVVADDRFGRTHYFPPGYDARERAALSLLRRESAADVVSVLMDDEPLTAGVTADRAGIARSTLSWHLDRLVEAGLVEKRYDRGQVVLSLVDSARIAQLLDRADPTLPERLVDRFTRLIDSLLEE